LAGVNSKVHAADAWADGTRCSVGARPAARVNVLGKFPARPAAAMRSARDRNSPRPAGSRRPISGALVRISARRPSWESARMKRGHLRSSEGSVGMCESDNASAIRNAYRSTSNSLPGG